MPKTVILSPHYDDAVIDAWFVLVREPDAVVMTVCAKIPDEGVKTFWDTVCGERNSHKQVQIRRSENDKASQMSGTTHKQVLLDYLDGQYPGSDKPIDSLVADILANSPKEAIFLAPLATSKIFRHKDHKVVREAALQLIGTGRTVHFYPDSPYMTLPNKPNQKIILNMKKRAEDKLGLKLDYVVNNLSESERESKKRALRAYKSQYTPANINSFGGLTRVVNRSYELIFIPG